jgi:hypothetical protein
MKEIDVATKPRPKRNGTAHRMVKPPPLAHLLVDDWRDAWKWAENWVSVLLIAWGALPADMQANLLGGFVAPSRLPFWAGVLGLMTRMWSQRVTPPH